MKLFEYMGKRLLADFGISIPQGTVCSSPYEAVQAFLRLKGPAVIKAQVLSGKRGKHGGVRMVDNEQDAFAAAQDLLQAKVQGYPVEKVLVEEKLAIDQEVYVSITVNRQSKCPVLIASAQGGMDIEAVPMDQIVRQNLDVALGLPVFLARDITRRLGVDPSSKPGKALAELVQSVYRLFMAVDAELVEINPAAICQDSVYAADAKITIDDASMYRNTYLPVVDEKTEAERKANQLGLAYVDLDGDIGVMANGAGITMATLDTITYLGKRPANFLDAGGGAGQSVTSQGLELVLAKKPQAVLVNIFGGITRCDDVARAITKVKKEQNSSIPIVVRLTGVNQDSGRAILAEAGVEVFDEMQLAAQRAVELAN
jgi:succinyl-CoA synthetase beta subunit